MAKKCMYCEKPLAKEDARFCNECGRLQIPEPAPSADPSPIKVKLPPKEFTSRNEPVPPFQPKSNQSAPGGVRLPGRETPAPIAPSSYVPKRPGRSPGQDAPAVNRAAADWAADISAADTLNIDKQSKIPGEAASAARRAEADARPEKAQPTPVEEISTMVLPGWREELEHLRKERAAASSPAAPAPEIRPASPPASRPASVPRRPESGAITPGQGQQSTRKTPPEEAQSRPVQESKPQAERPRPAEEQVRREPRVKVWEQEPTIQYPQVRPEKKEDGPPPAVEHTPFANITFDQEDIAEQATVNWQTLSSPSSKKSEPAQEKPAENRQTRASASLARGETAREKPAEPTPVNRQTGAGAPFKDSATVREGQAARIEDVSWQSFPITLPDAPEKAGKEQRQPPAEAVESEPERNEVEDLPTVPLAVPEAAKRQPSITIERASTPAPSKRSAPRPQEEGIEDLPTRPLTAANPASSAGPRSPIPPVAPQPLQGQREARPAPSSSVPNTPSSPGVYGPPPAQQARSAAHTPGAPTARGSVANPPSQPPHSQGPASLPGNVNASFKAEAPAASPRPPSFAPTTPPPSSPRPAPPSTEPAAPPRQKKRLKPSLAVALILLILVIGAGSFVFYYQSTSGTGLSFQSFQNSRLGVALNYPQSWTSRIDQAQSSVHFADSSQTGQVTLSVAAANAQQASQYLNQETTRLGINGPRSGPAITFGGANWQTVEGNIVQKGATYRITLYVAQHGNSFYALTCMAPLSAYGQMEQESFAPLRSSFRFL